MSFPRYSAYKDSGVEWLGSIPKHWPCVPLKHLADFINGEAFKPTEWAESGMPIIRIQNLNGGEDFNYFDGEVDSRYLVHSGDLLFGWSGNRGTSFGPFRWAREQTCVLNQHIFRVVPKGVDKNGLYWILKAVTAHVEDQAHGIIGMVHVTKGDLGAIRVPLPGSDELVSIAGFLDRETAKIDFLVAEQEQLITLLKEKRQAVISHAVTKGLDLSEPMKDSGVEWLGEVPEHWQVRRVKDVTRLESGHTPSKTVPEYWVDCDIPWVSLNDSKYLAANDYVTDTAVQINQLGIENSSARLLPAGSVVFTRDATIGLAAITTREMAVSQHLIAWCPTGLMDPLYLLRVFNAMKDHLDSYTLGATIKTIGMGDVKSLTTPVPPHDEQVAIAAFLGKELQVLDQLVDEAVLSIELLRERRSALISAAVTGQIDVRGLASAQEQAA